MRAGMTTGMNPYGRVRAHGAQERYRCEEWARWGRPQGWPPLRLEQSWKQLVHKAGWTRPQLAERRTRRDAMARGRKVASTFSDDANPRSGGRGATSLSSCVLARFPCGCGRRSSIGVSAHCRRHADRRCSPHHPRIAAARAAPRLHLA